MKTVHDHLTGALENLQTENLKKFKAKLNEVHVKKGCANIPRGLLEKADVLDLVNRLLSYYGEKYAVQVTVNVLKIINCKDQAEKLHKDTTKMMHFIERHQKELIQQTAMVEGVLDMLDAFPPAPLLQLLELLRVLRVLRAQRDRQPERNAQREAPRLDEEGRRLHHQEPGEGWGSGAMPGTAQDQLRNVLEELEEQELERFKSTLNQITVRPGFENIPRGRMEKKDSTYLSHLLVSFYTEGYALELTAEVLEAINRKDQAVRLRQAARIDLR
ncbi:uncharacterized protein [Tiliqua scincoides]|uniref:uncharacterized protein n=1 Tax=Tiliqua scincoides TaxID=71010 RepID=UPI003462055F